jgi:hypothetical protein
MQRSGMEMKGRDWNGNGPCGQAVVAKTHGPDEARDGTGFDGNGKQCRGVEGKGFFN